MTLRCAENCNGALAFLGCTRQGLIKRLIEDAGDLGFSALLLDSTQFMASAHALYRAAGFTDTDAYPEAEDHGALTEFVIHMKYELP